MTHREGEPADIGKLVTKLAEVMELVTHVEKKGRNAFFNYDYATEGDVSHALRKELAVRKVVIFPAIASHQTTPIEPTKSGTAQWRTDATMIFTAIDGDTGASISVPWVGCGVDNADKGVYKATSGGEKYFLLKLFLLPTGDDPEEDRQLQGEVATPRAQTTRAAAAPRPTAGASATQPATDAQKRKLWARNSELGMNEEDLHFVIHRMYKHDSINDVLKTQIDDILTNLQTYAEYKEAKARETSSASPAGA